MENVVKVGHPGVYRCLGTNCVNWPVVYLVHLLHKELTFACENISHKTSSICIHPVPKQSWSVHTHGAYANKMDVVFEVEKWASIDISLQNSQGNQCHKTFSNGEIKRIYIQALRRCTLYLIKGAHFIVVLSGKHATTSMQWKYPWRILIEYTTVKSR